MKSVELTIKLRNNLLKERRLKLGFTTVEMAEVIGVAYEVYIRYENMLASPLGHGRGRPRGACNLLWKPSAHKIAEYHRCLPEDLWPQALLAITQPEVATKVNAEDVAMVAQLAASVEPLPLPEIALDQRRCAEAVAAVLDGLTKREQVVLRRRFGLDGEEPETMAIIGDELGVLKERVRQIEAKALRKLRHPSRTALLVGFLDDEAKVEKDEEKRWRAAAGGRRP